MRCNYPHLLGLGLEPCTIGRMMASGQIQKSLEILQSTAVPHQDVRDVGNRLVIGDYFAESRAYEAGNRIENLADMAFLINVIDHLVKFYTLFCNLLLGERYVFVVYCCHAV